MIKILVVEDNDSTRNMLEKFLKHKGYDVETAVNGHETIKILEKKEFDVVLMDIDMPKMDGIETTKEIRKRNIPVIVIMLTAFSDEKIMKSTVEAGADDYITKPVNFDELDSRIKLATKVKLFYIHQRGLTDFFKNTLFEQTKQLEELKQKNHYLGFEALEILYSVAEYRDDETYEHTQRVGWISGMVASELNLGSKYSAELQFAAPLHDIGKIGIPDRILLKPARLTPEEYEEMKMHTIIGCNILKKSSASSILRLAAEVALTHHERWNGSGYPRRLREKEIPISGLIVAVVDSYDAMVSKRPYKDPISHEKVIEEIKKLSGILYSPEVVEAFLNIEDDIVTFYG